MIIIDKAGVVDLYIPRSINSGYGATRNPFGKKDVMEILKDYITIDDATAILGNLLVDYIEGSDFEQIIIDTLGNTYTKDEVDAIVAGIRSQIDGMDFATEQWVEDKGYIDDITLTINGQEVHNGDSVTIETQATPPAMFIYVDDFPDGVAGPCWDPDTGEEIPCPHRERYSDEWIEEFYGFDDLDSYLDWYLEELGDAGCNTYIYKGEFEYDGEDYWLYQYSDQWGGGDSVKYGLLPKSVTREELEENSLMTDHQNIFNDYTPFAYYLRYDGREYELNAVMPYILVGLK